MIQTINKIMWNLDEDFNVMGVMIDVSKAFDIIDRELLLRKLNVYGIRGKIGALIKYYLKNRTSFVQWGDKDSDIKENNYKVPQGSNVGPIVFIIFVNDRMYIRTTAIG